MVLRAPAGRSPAENSNVGAVVNSEMCFEMHHSYVKVISENIRKDREEDYCAAECQ